MDQRKSFNRQVFKFGLYGFFKNLRFFDPILLIYLYNNGLLAFHIGILYAVREIVIYLFEIPSGVFADRYGKKTELILCFVFYILSFVIFAIGSTFAVYFVAMMLFGLGEAFRSGTHKAMIMLYLDQQDRSDEKSKTYGKTRSMSMLGSTISSLFTIVLVLQTSDLRFLFFLAIIPYVIDMILIVSYPNSLNDKHESSFSWKSFWRQNVESIQYVWQDKKLNFILVRSASYQAMFKILKDFIQLILVAVPITYFLFSGYSAEDHTNIYSAMMYAMIFLISALSTRNAYRLLTISNHEGLTKLMWGLSGVASLAIGLFTSNLLIVFVGFIFLYVFLNIRKPLMVEVIGDHTDPARRASVLSIDSQLTSLLIVIFAPLLGYLSDTTSLSFTFQLVGIIMIVMYLLTLIPNRRSSNV